MLTREQLVHFAQHGWVIKDGVFTPEFMDHCRRVMDETAATKPGKVDEVKAMMLGIVNHHQLYRDLLLNPMLLEDSRQLIGTDLTHRIAWMIVKKPHPERHQNRSELINPEKLEWHRDMRPKWGTFVDACDEDVRSIIGGNDGWGYPGQHPIATVDFQNTVPSSGPND